MENGDEWERDDREQPDSVVADSNLGEEYPPPPPPLSPKPMRGEYPPTLGDSASAPPSAVEGEEDLWRLLQQEAYRQRGEGYRSTWAFHLTATEQQLGFPLAPSARDTEWIIYEGKQYGFQPFARDTLYNEIPQWGKVQSLNALLEGKMPGGGLGLLLLQATYRRCGSELNPGWAFHQVALKEQLGPALSKNYRITVEGAEYAIQVFAGDTLYSPVPRWSDVQRLSSTPPGALRDALWKETHRVAQSTYQPDDPFHHLATTTAVGAPLSPRYTVDVGGATLHLQVFAQDVFYAWGDGNMQPRRQSAITNQMSAPIPRPPAPLPGGPDDALSRTRPTFTMLPVAGMPGIAQFYGHTRYAVGSGSQYYRSCQGRHPGIDFSLPEGTPLLSVGYGVVMCAGVANTDCSFGGCPPMMIIVRYGTIYVLYGHARSVSVRKGQRVGPGELLGHSGTYGSPHLHFEIRPVPESLLGHTDPNQVARNPGYAVNPVGYFSPDLQAYFERSLARLGGISHFCRGDLYQQETITFGGPIDTRPCTNPE